MAPGECRRIDEPPGTADHTIIHARRIGQGENKDETGLVSFDISPGDPADPPFPGMFPKPGMKLRGHDGDCGSRCEKGRHLPCRDLSPSDDQNRTLLEIEKNRIPSHRAPYR